MNDRELLFIIRFKNEASRALKTLRTQLRNAGRAAQVAAKKGFARAAASLRALGATALRVGARVRTAGNAIRELGTNIAFGIGAPVAAAFVIAARESIKFESTMIGVSKTVDGTKEQIAALGREITELSNRIPVGANELGRIAAVAGQLGVARGDVTAFSETVARLAISAEDLSETDAAFALARFGKVLGLPTSKAENLSASIVDLGNNFATTEGQILEVAKRLAPIGATFDLSAGTVFGFATALKSAGLQSQAGGTAIQQSLVKIQKAVTAGGEKLKVFAETAGVPIAEFKRLVEEDAGLALTKFIEGLGGLSRSGAVEALTDVGLATDRAIPTLLGLAKTSAVLKDAVETGNRAFEEGTAAIIESDKFFASFANRLKLVGQQVLNAARAIGDAFRPEMEKGLEALKRFAGFLQRVAAFVRQMDDATRSMVIRIALIAVVLGPVLLVLGTFLAIIGSAISGIGILFGVLSRLVNILGVLLVRAIGLAVGAFTFLLSPIGLVVVALAGISAALLFAADESVSFANVARDTVNSVIRAFQTLGASIGFVASVFVTVWTNALERVKKEFALFGTGLKALFTGDFSGAADAFREAFTGAGGDVFEGVEEQADAFQGRLTEIAAGDPLSAIATKGKAAFTDFVEDAKRRITELFGFTLPAAAAAGGEQMKVVTMTIGDAVEENLTPDPTLFEQFLAGAKEGVVGLGTALTDANVFSGVFDSGIDALQEFVTTGKASFQDFARDALAQISRVILKLLVLRAIEAASTALGGGSGAGSTTGSIIGALGGTVSAAAQRRGGLAGHGPQAAVPAGAFAAAHRFQAGGVVPGQGTGDKIPALLEPGERVLSRSQRAQFESGQGRSRAITVNVNVSGVTDASSFRENKGAIQAQMMNALKRADNRDN